MTSNLSGWHALIILFVFALAVLPAVLALVSIARARLASGVEVAVWVLVVIIAPLLGSIAWFAIGRPRSRHHEPLPR